MINGEKLWCTNGPAAEVLVVMARTPSKIVNGKERKQITAFIVERDAPGFELVLARGELGVLGRVLDDRHADRGSHRVPAAGRR